LLLLLLLLLPLLLLLHQQALDYYDIILDPVDLLLIGGRLASRSYYASLEMFVADVRKMCDNCK
jgi:histone acetyltransferase